MSPRLRKLALTAHVASSVGWLGAVVAFLALAVEGWTGEDAQAVQGAYLAMQLIGGFVLVPLSLTSLLTWVLQALGTKWGLFRHYWVVVKLSITVVATFVLLSYTQTLDYLSSLASAQGTSPQALDVLRTPSPVLHAGAAMLLLLVAATLSVFKPRGITRYGWRKHQEA